jgi:hypothetical protein
MNNTPGTWVQPFRVAYTAPANSLYVGAGGVGIGTSSPVSNLTINGDAGGLQVNHSNLLFDSYSDGVNAIIGLSNTFNEPPRYRMGFNNNIKWDIIYGDTIFFNYFSPFPNSVQRLTINGGTGAVSIPGTLSKGGGSFDIEHPDPIKAEAGYRLRHCFVESPTRGDNIYRFKVQTTNKMATLTLPDYYQHLNENTQVFVTAEWSENAFGHGCGRLNPQNPLQVDIRVTEDGEYNVLIIGTRKDQLMKDFWDEKGAEYIP